MIKIGKIVNQNFKNSIKVSIVEETEIICGKSEIETFENLTKSILCIKKHTHCIGLIYVKFKTDIDIYGNSKF